MFIFKIVRLLLKQFNFEIKIYKSINNFKPNNKDINLNIGCGDYKIDNFISLDIPSDHYNKNDHSEKKFRSFNIIKDTIPFKNNSVKNIYISHVIYKMLLSGVQFKNRNTKNFIDWGTQSDWDAFISNYKK